MVPAYDNPTVWEGHSSMVHEIQQQLKKEPDAIFCSVGGAGLLGGIIVGCKDVGWDHGKNKIHGTLECRLISLDFSPLGSFRDH